ncbi:hypothetical protein HNO88_000457 [Novosphingobium chloroacetimidivorans]|uniref:Uncharacterized protein n=1 Tax=Novosphingobium chloroacetimidivorans TaxID=1428314 RepID=A0A7W7K738_9SPHN|nr:hypothetical protein [Novosphingobium chloroacetimidivorans]MBB4857160.1 hypothetical protein [Novosphingobium chloroacetimidivorans]
MSTETAMLIDHLWRAIDLDQEAERVSKSLTKQQSDALQGIVAELNARISAKRVLKQLGGIDKQVVAPMSDTNVKGLLILLVLASYHSDGLLFLPAEERHDRVRRWSERTGFAVDFVQEAAVLGPAGLSSMLEAA